MLWILLIVVQSGTGSVSSAIGPAYYTKSDCDKVVEYLMKDRRRIDALCFPGPKAEK